MNRKGVTLIELIVVMVIIAIGAALMAPNIGGWLPSYRLRSATRDIASLLRTANMKAVSTNLEYRVYFDAPKQIFWLERGNKNSDSTNWGKQEAKEGADYSIPSGISISYTSNYIEFNPDSTCAPGASITLTTTKGKQSSITVVTSTSRVNVSL